MTLPADSHTRQIRRRYRNLLLSLVVLIMLVAVQPVLWRLVKRQAAGVHAQQTQQQQQIDVQQRTERMRADVAQQQEVIASIGLVSPPLQSLPQVVERLENLADRRGLSLTINNINQSVAEQSAVLVPVIVSFEVVGQVEALLGYFEQIEHTQELTMVQSWSLTPLSASVTSVGVPLVQQYQLVADVSFFLINQDNVKP